METIDYNPAKKVLLSVKGHPYDRNGFFRIFEQQDEVAVTAVEQPATEYILESPGIFTFDALVFYDMPGIDFSSRPPCFVEPSASLKSRFQELTKQGMGLVFLHHAIAGWPTWEEYGDIIGGRFFYRPSELKGVAVADSGYRHAVDYRAQVLCEHPVTQGIPASFPVRDELYLYEVLDDDLVPLLASSYDFSAENFNSAFAAVGGGNAGAEWHAKPGSNLIGWARRHNNSPVVYLQMGDAPDAYGNEHIQKLIFNAIAWVSSPEAKAWARQR